MILVDVAVFLSKRILCYSTVNVSSRIVGSSRWSALAWDSPAVDTPAAPLSGMMPWKVAAEYRSSKVKTESSVGSLKMSIFVMI